MKRMGFASLAALFLLSLTTPRSTQAQTEGPYARGSYRFLLEDGLTKLVEFDATTDERGIATGLMTFLDSAKIPDADDVEDPRSGDAPPEFYIRAELDGLTVEKNRAVMSGKVLESSHKTYIGRWVQLVVEDSGDDPRAQDRLTWAFCRPRAGGWVPTDAERQDDDGAYLRWWATDAERKDDVGVPSPNLLPDEDRGCQLYPLLFYSFADVQKWEGDIVVQP